MTEPIAPQRDTQIRDQLRRAVEAAFSGSAEHGAFLRDGGSEYVPSPFLLLDQLQADHDAAEQQIATLTAQRDKWLAAFNRSEQFQNGPTKRAVAAEAHLTALQDALARLADDWTHHVISLSLPTIEAREACAAELRALLSVPQAPAERTQE